jgi:hypothetical protein
MNEDRREEAVVRRRVDGKDDDRAGDGRVRDVPLRPRQAQRAVTPPRERGAHGEDVRARVALGDRDGEDHASGDRVGQQRALPAALEDGDAEPGGGDDGDEDAEVRGLVRELREATASLAEGRRPRERLEQPRRAERAKAGSDRLLAAGGVPRRRRRSFVP